MFATAIGRVKVKVNKPELIASMQIACGKLVVRRAAQVAVAAKRHVGVETGALLRSIHAERPLIISTYKVRSKVTAKAGSGERARRAIWHHEGTGIWAGHGLIKPTRANKLVFRWVQQGGILMVVNSVRGQQPNPYLTDGLREVLRPLGWTIKYKLR